MKTTILTRCVMALMMAGAAFTACTKNNMNGSSSTDAGTTANLQTAADDESQVSYESDAMDNDANTAAWAEWRFGAAQNESDLVCITLGTGIGGGLVFNGQVHRGRNGIGGEFGHMQVVKNGHACECGNRGCWEQYASANALVATRPALTSSALSTGPSSRTSVIATICPVCPVAPY